MFLTSCSKRHTPANSPVDSVPPPPPPVASTQTGSSPAARKPRRVVLPNLALAGCKTGSCSQVLPDKAADPDATYPWQVMVDINGGEVIGLIALYDQPTTMDDLQAAVDERYGKFAMAQFRTGPARLWRVEPENTAIQLSVAGSGMVQLIYLTFGAKHPASDQAIEYQACVAEKSAKCAARARQRTSAAPDLR